MLQVRRSRGVLSGILLALLGIWGALIPFIGPDFHYAYTPDKAWTYNTGRLWLEILPGAAALLGGLLLMGSSGRHVKLFGAMLGILAGAWFVTGNIVAPLWTTVAPAGSPASATTLMRAMEQIGFFGGLGAVLVLVAGFAAGRLTAVPGIVVTEPVAAVPASTVPVSTEADRTVADRTLDDGTVADRTVDDSTVATRSRWSVLPHRAKVPVQAVPADDVEQTRTIS